MLSFGWQFDDQHPGFSHPGWEESRRVLPPVSVGTSPSESAVSPVSSVSPASSTVSLSSSVQVAPKRHATIANKSGMVANFCPIAAPLVIYADECE